MNKSTLKTDRILTALLIVLSVVFFIPLILVLVNSFKSKFTIISEPFVLPNAETFVGFENYLKGIATSDFFGALGRSLFITVGSVLLIVFGTSMTAWYITRIKTVWTKLLYTLFIFSMIVPFQMVMYTMVFTADRLQLNNPIGALVLYLGFGAGLSVFIFSGFVKSIPLELEEAATIDGCKPLELFYHVVFPVMRPTAITVAVLNAMWIWNDYLLPYLVLGTEKYKTLPVTIQITMQGAYGSVDWGGFMAMLVLAIIPIVIFYLSCQKYIIKGVIAGAVKG